ncbi:MAG: hypothetical protein ACTH5W_06330 [Providencia sp.]|uniref:hypothetical protein n=1 Tax=Providencia sp. TaxID=589 RepID=UPI003F9A9D28
MNLLTNKNNGEVIIILTASWRYFALGSLLAFTCQFILYLCSFSNRISLFIGTTLFIINHYYIYRLWLDNHFFKLIYHQGTTRHFDEAFFYLFPNKQPINSMEKRWFGTKKLFNYCLVSIVLLWGWLLLSIIVKTI